MSYSIDVRAKSKIKVYALVDARVNKENAISMAILRLKKSRDSLRASKVILSNNEPVKLIGKSKDGEDEYWMIEITGDEQ